MKTCSICPEKYASKGYCEKHYRRFKKHGNPFIKLQSKKSNTLEKMLIIIEKIPINENGCKIWPMGIGNSGYGIFSINDKSYSPHRLLFYHNFPETEKKLFICHKCNIRSCCNIEHLYAGTQIENMKDRNKIGRYAHGEKCNLSRFTEEQIIEIRSLYPNFSIREISEKFNTLPSVIGNILKNKSWKHICGELIKIKKYDFKGENAGKAKLKEKQVLEIRQKYPELSKTELSKKYKVSFAAIHAIVTRRSWGHI